ncbi:hypothetical protein KJ564_12715 [bacterium]|nr:hypothetical protein [bacterium]MBU1881518.1 hypothetical protein [bacterium]
MSAGSKWSTIASMLTLLVFLGVTPSQAKLKVPFTLKVSYSGAYDDNILRYSDRDLDRFENDSEVYPSEVTTTDDWANSFTFRLYKDVKLGKYFRFRPYYNFKISLYSINEQKNYSSHFFLARFTYRYRYYLYLQYSVLDDYYLRLYRDRDSGVYHSCEFDQYKPTVKLRWHFSPFNLEASYSRELLYYNPHFTEYDNEGDVWGIEASYELPIKLQLSAGYFLTVADNVGFDQTGAFIPVDPSEDAEYGDSSYEEDEFIFNVRYPLPVKKSMQWVLFMNLSQRFRYYQTDLSVLDDPFHAGREDHRTIIDTGVSFSPSSDLDIELQFTIDQRRTDSPAETVSSIKDYDRRTVELIVTYQVF